MNIGETKIVTATPKPDDAKDKELIWKSNDESIATVNNGVIAAINTGTTKVIVTSSSNTKIKKQINVTVNKKEIMTSTDTCINNSTKCSNGTLVTVKVNDTTSYDFYVIDDTKKELTLIMDRNLGGKVEWIAQEDYEAGGGKYWDKSYGKNNIGPLTALNYLENLTKGWTNIPSYDYTLEDDKPDSSGKTVRYQPIERRNVRARMLTYTEAHNHGCTGSSSTCPKYLYENLSSSNTDQQPYMYWLSTACSDFDYASFNVRYGGYVANRFVKDAKSGGIRPVIKISKNL